MTFTNSREQTTQFSSLPQEIRDQIWSFSLPSRRIFDLQINGSPPDDSDGYSWTFKTMYSLPVALRICRETREAALRQGFFFTPHHSDKSIYINPETDILYFSWPESQILKEKEPINMPGLDRILNVGVGWSAFFEDDNNASLYTGKEYWREVTECLYLHMPHLKTINHIFPKPTDWPHYEYGLKPLRGDARVPWIGTQYYDIDDEDPVLFAKWRVVKGYVENALEESERRPELLGWELYATSIGPEAFSYIFRDFLRRS